MTWYYQLSQTMRAYTGLDPPRHSHAEMQIQMRPEHLTLFMLLWPLGTYSAALSPPPVLGFAICS